MKSSAALLEQFRQDRARYGAPIELGLRPVYLNLLAALDHPERRLPPVFHVAGTNGKGSVCAFLRAILEAGGCSAHAYTSPHLLSFHERIRLAGRMITEEELTHYLERCAALAPSGDLTLFEAGTAAALLACAEHPADFTILEVGLGGRLDATNVIGHPLAALITRISFDHREYLGDTLAAITREKAGIMKNGVPCFAAAPINGEVEKTLRDAADAIGAPLYIAGADWHGEKTASGFRYSDGQGALDLPSPSLLGAHQIENACVAIAALRDAARRGAVKLSAGAIARGLQKTEWPARLQRLTGGALSRMLPKDSELWLDGGHNDSAGQALARQAETWRETDAKPLYVICGMLASKQPRAFLAPLAPYIENFCAVAIPDEQGTLAAETLAADARAVGIENAAAASSVQEALQAYAQRAPARILICGSLYLAGATLRLEAPP